MDPLLAGIFHDQRAQRKGERHGEPDVAQIEHGRVNHHLRILQKRIQAIAVGWDGALNNGKGMRRKVQQQQEENLHARQNHRSIGK